MFRKFVFPIVIILSMILAAWWNQDNRGTRRDRATGCPGD
jgi:hypothetical protein